MLINIKIIPKNDTTNSYKSRTYRAKILSF